MLIDYIRITNWRSFYGQNNFFVSKDPQRNVTLIRAENGVGKTSLLAAINWCFFGDLPSENEFENRAKLVNEYATTHDGVTRCTVEIDFEHEGKVYRAHRMYDQIAKAVHDLRLSELVDGGTVPLAKDRPDRFINSVIPREMAPHFFFYGEATSRYTGATGAKKFGEAVKGILGSTIARMALDDIKKVWLDYNKQASDNTSEEARQAEHEIESASTQIARLGEELNKLEKETDAAELRIEKLNQDLAGTKPAKEAQARRGKLEAQLSAKEGERTRALQRSEAWIQNYIVAVLSEELVAEASDVIKKEDTRGKIPAPYDQKFVNELLADGKCVCGRPLSKGSPEYECVLTLLNNAGDQAVMSRVMSTNAALGRLSQRSGIAWAEFERNNDDLRRVEGEIQRLDADLMEISKELAANPITDVAEKEAARERAKEQLKQANSRKVDVKTSINGFERQRETAEARRNELVKKSEAARRFVKRAQLAGALMARLESRLKIEEEEARAAIEREIDTIVQRFMRKPATVKLNSDYQLRLFDERGLEIAKSTGENQLLGLAFTGAIAKFAKEREKEVDDILLPGTVAPLVVDSPFGHLDPLYRRSVAEFLPELASQVILLVSTSQASDAVMNTIATKVGQEYVLTRHNRSGGEGKQPEWVEIRGKSYELTRYSSHFDGTQITEVLE
jgi:DNA sulfur modification protein DndD